MSTFLDNYLEYVDLRDLCKEMSLKDYFEFIVYWVERDGGKLESLEELDKVFYYEENGEYDGTYELMHDKYLCLLEDYLVEKGIVYDENKAPGCDRSNSSRIQVYEYAALLSYLFKLYDMDISHSKLNFDRSMWYRSFLSMLGIELQKSFLKEWNKLKFSDLNNGILQRASLLGVGLKDSFYDLRADACVDWEHDEELLKCKDNGMTLFDFFRSYNFYNHNDLRISRKFIDDNEQLIDKDELLDWCEYVVNLTFRDLGLRYNKGMIEKFEQEEEQEIDLER